MSFTFVELQILIGLSQGKTLAEIGAELYLGQPAISKILHALELKAGLPLLERHGRKLGLTPAGAEVARAAQAAVAQLQGLERLVETMRAGQSGPLRLAATNTPGNYVLPPIIGEFLQQFPGTQLVLRVVSVEHLWNFLLNEWYDFAIGPLAAHPEGLQLQPLYEDTIVFFVAPRSRLARQPSVSWEAIQQETLIGPFSLPYWAQLFEQLGRRGITLSRCIDLRALEGVKRLVEAGAGIGVLFGAALRREFEEGRLRPLALADPALTQTFCLIQRQDAQLAPIARRFRDFLLRRLSHTTFLTGISH
ncbi:MAG TPA: LysR family transcriptional regulator [Chloroflexota bacterium]|nr:LysR family transcriptional regulator [Chloroflexota bacterium]